MGKLVDLRVWWWECALLYCRKDHADIKDSLSVGPFLTERKLISWKRAFLREVRAICKENDFRLMNFPGKTTVFFCEKSHLVEPVQAAWVAEGFFYLNFDEKWAFCK